MAASQVRPGCRSPFRAAQLHIALTLLAWRRLERRYCGFSLSFLDGCGRPVLLTPHRTPVGVPNSTPWRVTHFHDLDGTRLPAGHSVAKDYREALSIVRAYGGRLESAELPRLGLDVLERRAAPMRPCSSSAVGECGNREASP